MSAINPVGPPPNAGPIQKIVHKPIDKEIPPDASRARPTVDKLDISGVSHLLAALRSNEIRAEKVEQIRAQLEAGTYEDQQKLDAAIERLLDELQN